MRQSERREAVRDRMNAILQAAYSSHVKEGIKPEEQKLLDRLK